MIIYKPQTYTNKASQKSAKEFYAQLLNSFGIATGTVNIAPFHAQGDFECACVTDETVDKYFAIGDGRGDLDIGSQDAKVFYHGTLSLSTYLPVNASGSGIALNSLATGPNDDLTHWMVRQRLIAAIGVDVDIDKEKRDVFEDAFFCYLRKTVTNNIAGTNLTERTEWMFTGLKIDYV